MKIRVLRYPLLFAIIAVLALALVHGGIAEAGKKKSMSKGWLGVYIHDVDDDDVDAWELTVDEGVMIDEVIEDSPAEEAGLEAGDVIVKIDGKEVTSSTKLTRIVRRTKPDTEVEFEVFRDGETEKIAVTIGERDSDYNFSFDDNVIIDIPRIKIPNIRVPRIQSLPKFYAFQAGNIRPRIGVQLRDLNKQLGEYFGLTDGEGALVEKVIEDSPAEKAGIKAGDVIIAINGEEVADADEVIDEVSDLDEGDIAKITVLRDRAKKTFAVEVEEDDWAASGKGSWRTPRYSTPRTHSYFWNDDEDHRDHFTIQRGKSSPRVRFFSDEDDLEGLREIREELQEAMEELREELEDIRDELKEALEEWGDG